MDESMTRVTIPEIADRLEQRKPRRLPLTSTHLPAAVLILLKDGPEGPEVLLTQRSDAVQQHKGQVSFPGGAADPDDLDEFATATREAEEEIGLSRDSCRVIGRLDDYLTSSGFHIAPVVAVAKSFDGLHSTSAEVTDVFSFPLAHLDDPAHVQRIALTRRDGQTEDVLFVPFDRWLVWGITARILINLLEATR